MKDIALYEERLGLPKPWQVTKVDLSLELDEVVVHVAPDH